MRSVVYGRVPPMLPGRRRTAQIKTKQLKVYVYDSQTDWTERHDDTEPVCPPVRWLRRRPGWSRVHGR